MNNLRIKNLHKRLLKAGGKIVKEDSYLFKNKRADGGEVKIPPRRAALYALANKLADQKVARHGGTRNDYFMEAIKHIKANPERYREELSKYVDETPISVNNDIEDPEIVPGMTRGDHLNADDKTRKNMEGYVNFGQYGENSQGALDKKINIKKRQIITAAYNRAIRKATIANNNKTLSTKQKQEIYKKLMESQDVKKLMESQDVKKLMGSQAVPSFNMGGIMGAVGNVMQNPNTMNMMGDMMSQQAERRNQAVMALGGQLRMRRLGGSIIGETMFKIADKNADWIYNNMQDLIGDAVYKNNLERLSRLSL